MRCDAEAEATAAVPRRAARLPRVDCNAARLVRLPRRDERQHSSASVGSPLLFSSLLHVSSLLLHVSFTSRLLHFSSRLVGISCVRLRSREERSGAALPPPLSLSLCSPRETTRDARHGATRHGEGEGEGGTQKNGTEPSGMERSGERDTTRRNESSLEKSRVQPSHARPLYSAVQLLVLQCALLTTHSRTSGFRQSGVFYTVVCCILCT